jgi:hypothetical protein
VQWPPEIRRSLEKLSRHKLLKAKSGYSGKNPKRPLRPLILATRSSIKLAR